MKQKSSSTAPLVLVVSNRLSNYKGTAAHIVRDTYTSHLIEIAECVPVMLPLVGETVDLSALTARVDGILLTGSTSHLNPVRYGQERTFPHSLLDDLRDATSFPLIQQAIARDIPFLGICRGFQELNAVCGGTLHQAVQTVPGKRDHRFLPDLTMRENYHRRAHTVTTQTGGLFAAWNFPSVFGVNSLHEQGVDRLGAGLHAEAISEDGLVEAISMPGKRFIAGVQWHPEGDADIAPESRVLFEKFGEALRKA